MRNVPKNFYIFRHGECPLNASGHIQGQKIDGELTLRGCRQARRIGRKLNAKPIEIIVSSPMKRAMQTARIVAAVIDVPIVKDERLIEVRMGIVEGMHITDVENKYAELYQRWRNCRLDDTTTRFPDGETKAEVRKRIFEVLEYFADKTSYRQIAVSGHGITISQILLTLGIVRSDIPNGSVAHLSRKNRKWHFHGFLER